MKKHEFNFDLWCRVATGAIRYGPDRKAASQELREHLDDAFEAALARGLTEEEAENAVLESMGRAEEIRPQLAAIHKPFWGYVIQVSQIALIALLVLSLLPIWKYFTGLKLEEKPNNYKDFELYSAESYGGDTGRTLHHLSQPHVSFRSDGNTFTVTDAVLFTEYSSHLEADVTRLYLLVDQFSLLPATELGMYDGNNDFFTTICYFFMRDDRGNIYPLRTANSRSTYTAQSGVFTQTHECGVSDFPADAKWVEFCYERDGRSFSLRIDLTGGGGK
jgi:hypothetical protein